MRYHSSLTAPPPDLDLSEYRFGLELNFREDSAATHLSLHSSEPGATRELLHLCLPYKNEGSRYLEGHAADLYLAVPYPGSKLPCRLQVKVPFVTMEDLDTTIGARHRQDFDRVMDIAQRVISDAIEGGLVPVQAASVEIVAEALAPDGRPRPELVEEMGFCIGASWLTHEGRTVFTSYRLWDPNRREWSA